MSKRKQHGPGIVGGGRFSAEDWKAFKKSAAAYYAMLDKKERKQRAKVKPPPFDKKLWVEANCGGTTSTKHYLLNENPHTFPGRIRVWCSRLRIDTRISKTEIDRISPEAAYWLRGYLCGSEPNAPTGKDGDDLPFGHPKYQRWLTSAKLFARTGIWNSSERRCNMCRKQLLYSWPERTCQTCQKKRRRRRAIRRD